MASANSYPRYLTFKAGELEATLRSMGASPERAAVAAVATTTAAPTTTGTGSGRRILVKSHTCPVTFVDGITGRCRYTRGGPAWHVFQFEHGGDGTGFSLALLPPVHWTRPLPKNDIPAIEAKARELAEEAYLKAALREQKEYFARASEGWGRKKHPDRYRMTAKRAKQIGGRYALCYRMDTGDGLIPIAPSCEHLVQANLAWREKRDLRTVVGCCNRLDRCWQLPRFNPLYAEFDPRPKVQGQNNATAAQSREYGKAVSDLRDSAVAVEAQACGPSSNSTDTASPHPSNTEDDWDYLPDSEEDEEEAQP